MLCVRRESNLLLEQQDGIILEVVSPNPNCISLVASWIQSKRQHTLLLGRQQS